MYDDSFIDPGPAQRGPRSHSPSRTPVPETGPARGRTSRGAGRSLRVLLLSIGVAAGGVVAASPASAHDGEEVTGLADGGVTTERELAGGSEVQRVLVAAPRWDEAVLEARAARGYRLVQVPAAGLVQREAQSRQLVTVPAAGLVQREVQAAERLALRELQPWIGEHTTGESPTPSDVDTPTS